MKNDLEMVIIAFSIISLIIGVPTFFSGCNPNISNFCPSYDLFQGQVIYTKIYDVSCGSKSKKEDCYDSYVYASNTYEPNDITYDCRYPVLSKVSKSDAEDSLKKYTNGTKVSWYRRNQTKLCYSNDYILMLWYVGIIFLGFSIFGFTSMTILLLNNQDQNNKCCLLE